MTKMAEVIAEAVPEADRTIVALHTYLLMNTGGGRPSDCARTAVAQYQQLGRDEFIHSHNQASRDALKDCGCATCRRDYERASK